MTGSGKTSLARRVLSASPYVIVLDTKEELKWPGFTITNSYQAALNGKHTIYRPQSKRDIDLLFRYIYKAGGWAVYTDEVYTLGNGNVQSYPQSYIDLLTRGRSRHISVYTGTQRPRFLPLFCFTEARHIFLFELGSLEDTKHVAKMAGVEMLAKQNISGHDFIYYRREGRLAIRTKLGEKDLR